jgi:hypothetical protein
MSTFAKQQAAELHKQTTTGHSKSSTSASSGPSYKSTPTTHVCHEPTREQKEAENKLIAEWKKNHTEKYNEMLKGYIRAWAPSRCEYTWYPIIEGNGSEGGKRKHRRKTQKKRKAKAKSHKRR